MRSGMVVTDGPPTLYARRQRVPVSERSLHLHFLCATALLPQPSSRIVIVSMRCLSCATELPVGARFCPSCGQPFAPGSQLITSPGAAIAVGVNRLVSSEATPVGGLTPGSMIAGRYRVIGLLGRGGMGEVYRADDVKLGQTVALKFLPREMSSDAVWRERFFSEVRITRQLSHPNICRVYDIGDWDGRHFLSMEYIDGEDLASLLRRIGHLSNEKALAIARQLAAGL